MVQRSEVEKQLYEAVKHTIRPSESDLEAVLHGEPVPLSRPASGSFDLAFPDEQVGDAL
ncbi:hypothetical protein AB0P13_23165 [Rhodococcus pyridinivorans]|uniref:hypothetical protein n=1 Tax=Rhodococcus TaxID=1827 RepID=UPI000AE1B1A6|nr:MULTISPECIES: hypothetical protein [Rhodococcus]NCL75744.1 hypothetical protein [Rhodococcus sp. YH1]WKK14687.1 hypothetical protein QYN14_26320 [Rhodococcus ruber]